MRAIRCEECGDDVGEVGFDLTTVQLESLKLTCEHCGNGRVAVVDGAPCFEPSDEEPTLPSTRGKGWLFALLLLLAGCTGYAPADGVTASPELLDTCLIAAERWGETTGLLPSCDEGRPMVAGNVRGAPAGHTDGSRVTIEMTDPSCLELYVTHELGHVLAGGGDGDHARDGSLMSARPPSCGALITAGDLGFVCDGAPCAWKHPETEE